MQKRVLCFILVSCIGSFFANSAFAKVWALPDYQESFSSRTNDGFSHEPNNPSSRSCSTYGAFSSSSLGSGHVCEGSFYVGAQLCCTSSSCSDDYPYTSSDCAREGKIGAGNSCSDDDGTHYAICKCDSSKYPYSSSECIPSLSGASCTDSDGTHYQTCGTDPCAGKTPVTCPKALGCAETCDGTTCIRCNPQPDCNPGYHWDDNLGCVQNTCGSGFATSISDCGIAISNSHWELGSSTKGLSGDSYCYSCVLTCDPGYVFNSAGTSCIASGCTEGFATTVANCGSVTGGKFTLNSSVTSGQSGSAPCKKCEVSCESGYVADSQKTDCLVRDCSGGFATTKSDCGTLANGYYELGSTTDGYSGSDLCKSCEPKCNSGYVFNSATHLCEQGGCPVGFATAKSDCGTLANGYYELGSATNGYSGSDICKSCEAKCNSGYVFNSQTKSCEAGACPTGSATTVAGCGTTAGGTYSLGSTIKGYSGSQACKECIFTSTCTATLTSCPKGYECTSCVRDGTTYYEKTGNCASGYAKAALGLDKETCYDTKCAYDNLLKVPSNATTISLEGGKIYVSGCKSGYFTTYSGGCIIGCVSKTEGYTCPLGSYASKTEACQKCLSGVRKMFLDHSNTCYECCVPQLGFPECDPCSGAPSGSLPSLRM